MQKTDRLGQDDGPGKLFPGLETVGDDDDIAFKFGQVGLGHLGAAVLEVIPVKDGKRPGIGLGLVST